MSMISAARGQATLAGTIASNRNGTILVPGVANRSGETTTVHFSRRIQDCVRRVNVCGVIDELAQESKDLLDVFLLQCSLTTILLRSIINRTMMLLLRWVLV